MQAKCGIYIPMMDWNILISRLSRYWTKSSLQTTCWKLCLAASVYHIWLERNHRLHNSSSHSVNQIRDNICFMVQTKMASLKKVEDTPKSREIAEEWNLPSTIFNV